VTARDAVVGLDLGTTSTKALVRDVDGRDLALVEAATPWTTTATGGTETTAAALEAHVVRSLTAAVDRAEAAAGGLRVLGLGVTGFAESGVMLDPAGRPGTPVVAWFDRRGEEQVAKVAARNAGFERRFVRRTGLPWDTQATIAKLLWFADQGLSVSAGHRWASIPEHVVRVLGGELVSEPSLASRTGLLDQATGRVWADGVEALGLPATLLPTAAYAGTSVGALRHAGLPACFQGAALTVAGHDHAAAAIGVGATGADELLNSTGTADVIARSLPGTPSDDQRETLVRQGLSAGAHILPGMTLVLGGVRGGLLLRRVLTLLGAADGAARERLDVAALHVGALPVGLRVSADRGGDDVVLHVRDDARPAAVWAAATRYTAAETRGLLEELHRVVPPHRRAVASGGWTRMASVRAAKAAAIDRLEFSDVAEPGVAGAATLALQAAALRPAPAPEASVTTL
jgi:sugar (pentulose or hexulose) kinase